MAMDAWLRAAEWLCGEEHRRLIFEPLVADWQHDLDIARDAGRGRYAHALASGLFAYTRSLARCTMTARGWLPTPRAAQIVALTFVVAFDAALFLLWIASLPSGLTRDFSSQQTRYFLMSSAGLVFAPIMLPALFLMRRDARSTARHAVSVIMVGAVLAAGAVALSSPAILNRYFQTFEAIEADYQRNLTNDRAGRITYPGTAVRRLKPTTLEERRAAFERYQAWRAQDQNQRPLLTAQQQLRRMQPAALAIVFGLMGWTLAGLGPVSYRRAVMWWMLIYAASLAFGVMPRALTGIPIRGVPYEYALPMFGLATLALVIASWWRTEERRIEARRV
jgi:hypothetical protein